MDLPLLRFAHRIDCYFNGRLGVGRISRFWKQWPGSEPGPSLRAIRLHPSMEADLEQAAHLDSRSTCRAIRGNRLMACTLRLQLLKMKILRDERRAGSTSRLNAETHARLVVQPMTTILRVKSPNNVGPTSTVSKGIRCT